jgi:hypothetical protein
MGTNSPMNQQNDSAKRNFVDRHASGLKASVHNDTVAYGFSVVITAALAVVQAGRDTASIWKVLTFTGDAVLAFTVIETFVCLALRHRLEEESTKVRLLGASSASCLSTLHSQPCSPSTGCYVVLTTCSLSARLLLRGTLNWSVMSERSN